MAAAAHNGRKLSSYIFFYLFRFTMTLVVYPLLLSFLIQTFITRTADLEMKAAVAKKEQQQAAAAASIEGDSRRSRSRVGDSVYHDNYDTSSIGGSASMSGSGRGMHIIKNRTLSGSNAASKMISFWSAGTVAATTVVSPPPATTATAAAAALMSPSSSRGHEVDELGLTELLHAALRENDVLRGKLILVEKQNRSLSSSSAAEVV